MTAYPTHRAFYYRVRKKDGQADRFLTFIEEAKPKEGPLRGQPSISYRVWDRLSGIRVGPKPTRHNGGVRDGHHYTQSFSMELRDAWPKVGPLFDDGKEARTNLLALNGDQLPEDLRQRCERELRRAVDEERIPRNPPQ